MTLWDISRTVLAAARHGGLVKALEAGRSGSVWRRRTWRQADGTGQEFIGYWVTTAVSFNLLRYASSRSRAGDWPDARVVATATGKRFVANCGADGRVDWQRLPPSVVGRMGA